MTMSMADESIFSRLVLHLRLSAFICDAVTRLTLRPLGPHACPQRGQNLPSAALTNVRRQTMPEIPNRPEYQSDLFKKGLQVRREVLGGDYVDGSIARADDFNAAFQQMTTEVAWGMCWTRPGIDRKTRSMINLTMLSALNRGSELRLHLKAALTNGVSRDEIKEILMQVGAYFGIPACLEAFKIATEVFKEVDAAKG